MTDDLTIRDLARVSCEEVYGDEPEPEGEPVEPENLDTGTDLPF